MGWRAVSVAVGVLGVAAVVAAAPVGALAATGASGAGGTGEELAPVWIAPLEKPGTGTGPGTAAAATGPGLGEARAGCGDLVAWADGPAGSGTWAARPIGVGVVPVPVVIGTWHRAAAGVAPIAALGQLAGGRYQLTFEGDLLAARVLTVDCSTSGGSGAAGRVPVTTVAMPPALPQRPAPVDAEGSTIPPIGEEPVAATGGPGVPGVPRSPVAGWLAVGLLVAVGVAVGARRAG